MRPQRMSARELALAAAYDEMRRIRDRVDQGAGEPDPADRPLNTAMAEAFSDLEQRADMDPNLANDALARLGYREYGGLRAVDYIPGDDRASHVPNGITRPSSLSRARIRALRTMFPERVEAWENGETDYLIPPRSVMMGSDVYAPDPMSHEFRHGGVDILDRLLADSPELQARYSELRSEGIRNPRSWETNWRSSRDRRFGFQNFNEALVEVRDDPDAGWNTPAGERATMADTIDHYDPDSAAFDGLRRYEEAYQTLAAEELARRGEPPRAVMRQPEPGSRFYREPEPERRQGIMGLFDRLLGR